MENNTRVMFALLAPSGQASQLYLSEVFAQESHL